jgi:hypothetical protein
VINFFVDAPGAFGIRDYVANRGRELADRVRVVTYAELADLTSLSATGTIFAGLDQASPTALAVAASVRATLQTDPAVAVLNSPGHSLGRYALLRRLYENGCNRFNVIRATDDPGLLRFPVFIRYERRHSGSLTPLLHDRQSLDRALGQLVVSGRKSADLLIVEFCDTVSPDGLYRKYSAMRIGDRILPRHLHASASWVAKSQTSEGDERVIREELAYLHEHPHAQWLNDVFRLAQIEYGRIDYGISNGQPQVWEINTNPTLGRGVGRHPKRDEVRQLREPGRTAAHQQMIEAFKRLERPATPADLPITIAAPLRARLRSEVESRPKASALQVGNALMERLAPALKGIARPVVNWLAPAVVRLVRHRV